MRRRSLLFIFLGLFQVAFAQNGKKKNLTSKEIILKSQKAYTSLETYLDSGKVITEYYNNSIPNKSSSMFRTAYSKVWGFNFDYFVPNKSNSLYTVNQQGDVIQAWWGLDDRVKEERSLSSALRAATGISSETSTLVPGLLLPAQFTNKSFYVRFDGNLTGSEKINKEDCFILQTSGDSVKTKIWISEKDFLIRKVETDRVIDPAKVRRNVNFVFQGKVVSLRKKLAAETDSAKRAAIQEDLKAAEIVLKNREKSAELERTFNVNGERKPFSVKTTINYYPYKLKKLNKELFTFRPHREVNL